MSVTGHKFPPANPRNSKAPEMARRPLSSMCNRPRTNILQLSPEILTEIFQNLELPDRKNVRLTCQAFYDSCNRISIISNEKFVLRSGYCIQEITKMLLSCQYLKLNLEFQGLPVDTFPGKIWTHCGDKVDSLTFFQSPVNDKVLKSVTIHCRNLKYWKIWVHSCNPFSAKSSGMESTKPFDELIKQKIVRKQLESFEVHIDNKGIWASIVKKVFVIFPNVKTFGALCWCSNGTLNYLEPSTRPLFAFTRIDKCLKSSNIERLVFDIPSDGHWLKNSSVWDLRLKEIQTSLYHTDKILETLTDFFSHQPKLEAICLTVNDITDKLFKKLLFHIIKVCPNLRRLRLNYPTTYIIDLNEYEFSLLLQKRLEFLKLRFNVNNAEPDRIVTDVKLPINRYLHTLVIDSHDSSENDYVLIMEYFQNLKHLDLCFITDAVLQAIIKNQATLEILKLNHIDNCTDFGFTGRRGSEDPSPIGYSIKNLKNLQCLDVNSWSSEGFTELTFLEFIFPKLKHFRFAVGIADNTLIAKSFVKIAENAPELEIVILDVFTLTFSQLLDFCGKLKKLYYIDCTEADIHDLDCVKLLLSCPSLRFVAYEDEIFCINPFTKKISLKPLGDFDIHSTCSVEYPNIL